jgi:large repetitive protein
MKTLRPLVTALLLLLPALLHAQRPMGEPFLVHLETRESQQGSRLAANAAGEFVVTWTSKNHDAGGYALYARRFGADGQPATGEILVTPAYLDFLSTGLAVMADGSFVVVFAQQVPGATALRARWYSPAGSLQDEAVLARGLVIDLSVASRGDGGVVLAWMSESPPHLRARAFGPDHEPLGPEVAVTRLGSSPELAVGPAGEFVVAFTGEIPGDPLDREDDRFFVGGRRFAADGTPLGRVFVASPPTEVAPFNVQVGKDGDGNFLVTWTGQFGTLGAGTFLRRYTADGAALNRVTRLPIFAPLLAVGPLGNFILAWPEPGVPEPTDATIFVRRFAADISPLGSPVEVAGDAPGNQYLSAIAIGAGGGFIATWSSDERDPDRILFDVFARRFRRR